MSRLLQPVVEPHRMPESFVNEVAAITPQQRKKPQHWLYPESSSFWLKFATFPSQRFVDAISGYLYKYFSKAIPQFTGPEIQQRIGHFFFFVCGRTPMSRGQILHAVILITRLIDSELEDLETRRRSTSEPAPEPFHRIDEPFEPIVTEANLGTLLLCALDISGKVNEDVPFNNKYWASLLQIDVRIVNSSELVFLQRLRFNTGFDAEEIFNLATELNLL